MQPIATAYPAVKAALYDASLNHRAPKSNESKAQHGIHFTGNMLSSQNKRQAVDTFLSPSPKAGIADVEIGETRTVTRQETLRTAGMSDCSAFILLSNPDEATGVYQKRSMIHIIGSELTMDLLRKGSAGEAICRLVDQAKQEKGPHKMIMAFGEYNRCDSSHEGTMQQSYKGRFPLLECLQLCGNHFEQYQMESAGQAIDVSPNGRVTLHYNR